MPNTTATRRRTTTTQAQTTPETSTRSTVPQIVTSQIIRGLEAGRLPWRKPWETPPPRNFINNHQYTGINWLLGYVYQDEHGYAYPYYATMKQINQAGGKVNAGSRGHIIVFTKRQAVSGSGTRIADDQIETTDGVRFFTILRYYYVFNIAQTTLDQDYYVRAVNESRPAMNADDIVTSSGANIRDGSRAYYDPERDAITRPHQNTFRQYEEFYATTFHELTHWTGHSTRLNRLESTHYGDGAYSLEELVAEIGSAMLLHDCDIRRQVSDNSQAYINGWLERLNNDPKFIIKASAKAQSARHYLQTRQAENNS